MTIFKSKYIIQISNKLSGGRIMWVQVIVEIFNFFKSIFGLLDKISITTTKAPETTTAAAK